MLYGMRKPRILAFSGSTRENSFNQRLIECAAQDAEDAGADVRVISLSDYALPLFDQDLESEQGQPENAAKLKTLLASHDGFLLASPEYNGSISPLLKNTLDWASRKVDDEQNMIAYTGKCAALLSASPGRLGGLRGLLHVRSILNNLGVLVIAEQATISSAMRAFDEKGQLSQESDINRVAGVSQGLVALLTRLHTD